MRNQLCMRTLCGVVVAALMTIGSGAVAAESLNKQLSDQLRCVRDAVYTEARGEPELGQLLVAYVVYVRAKKDRSALCEKVYEQLRGKNGSVSTQFAGPVYHPVRLADDDERLHAASLVAVRVALGHFMPEEKLRCITHYQNIQTADPKRSVWFNNLTPVATVGKHTFYCLPQNVALK